MTEVITSKILKSRIRRLSRFGLTPKDLVKIRKKQYNRCTICNRKFNKSLPEKWDHCHRCNRFRSLLCQRCNMGLGFFLDDIALLARAIVYLQDHDCEQD